jgi:hypothetical protein
MSVPILWLRLTELDRINSPELAERIALAEAEGTSSEPPRYPGYPVWPLPCARRRWWPGLDRRLQCIGKPAHSYTGAVLTALPCEPLLPRPSAGQLIRKGADYTTN